MLAVLELPTSGSLMGSAQSPDSKIHREGSPRGKKPLSQGALAKVCLMVGFQNTQEVSVNGAGRMSRMNSE